MNPNIKRVLWFIGIIGVGLIGLMVADQIDFLGGRNNTVSTIGTGSPSTASVAKPESGIDGVKKK